MIIRVEFVYDIEEILDGLDDTNIKVSKARFEKEVKDAFRDFAVDSIYAEYDAKGMCESVREKLIERNIIEEL